MKKKNIFFTIILSIMLSNNIVATTEDMEAKPSEGMAEPVIEMPKAVDEVSNELNESIQKYRSYGKTFSDAVVSTVEEVQPQLEIVNGVVRKKMKQTISEIQTKEDKEVKSVEHLEPAGVTSL